MANPGYTEEQKTKIVDEVCELIEDGMSARNALNQQKDKIPRKTFYSWIDNDESKRNQYARACEERTHKMADEILEIADFTENDTIETEKGPMPYNEWINRSKLRVDARKWLMSKMLPKVYGDKIDHTNDGGKFEQQLMSVQIVKPDED